MKLLSPGKYELNSVSPGAKAQTLAFHTVGEVTDKDGNKVEGVVQEGTTSSEVVAALVNHIKLADFPSIITAMQDAVRRDGDSTNHISMNGNLDGLMHWFRRSKGEQF